MPNIISTTVDTPSPILLVDGYMPNIISTTVDLVFSLLSLAGLYA